MCWSRRFWWIALAGSFLLVAATRTTEPRVAADVTDGGMASSDVTFSNFGHAAIVQMPRP